MDNKDQFNPDAMAEGLIAESPDVTAKPDEFPQDEPEKAVKSGNNRFMPEPDEQDKRFGGYLKTALTETLKFDESGNEAKKGFLSEIGAFTFSGIRLFVPGRASHLVYWGAFAGTGALLFLPEITAFYKKLKGFKEADDNGNSA